MKEVALSTLQNQYPGRGDNLDIPIKLPIGHKRFRTKNQVDLFAQLTICVINKV